MTAQVGGGPRPPGSAALTQLRAAASDSAEVAGAPSPGAWPLTAQRQPWLKPYRKTFTQTCKCKEPDHKNCFRRRVSVLFLKQAPNVFKPSPVQESTVWVQPFPRVLGARAWAGACIPRVTRKAQGGCGNKHPRSFLREVPGSSDSCTAARWSFSGFACCFRVFHGDRRAWQTSADAPALRGRGLLMCTCVYGGLSAAFINTVFLFSLSDNLFNLSSPSARQ